MVWVPNISMFCPTRLDSVLKCGRSDDSALNVSTTFVTICGSRRLNVTVLRSSPIRNTAMTGASSTIVLGIRDAAVTTGRGMARRLSPARRTVNDMA
jgi:hypothetical protein